MAEDEPQRGFTGWWIPVTLGEDKHLNWIERVLIVEIEALARGPYGCIASNAHFARHLGISQQRVIDILTKLRRLGYVSTVSFNGRRRELVAHLPASVQPTRKQVGSPRENTLIKIEEENTSKKQRARFTRPLVADLKTYAASIGFTTFNPQAFLDYYDSKDWMVGSNRMKDWKAAVRTWHTRDKERKPKLP